MAVDVGDGLFLSPEVIDEEDERRIIALACDPEPQRTVYALGALLHPTAMALTTLGWDGHKLLTQEQYDTRFPDWLTALWWKLVGRGVVPVQVASVLPDQVHIITYPAGVGLVDHNDGPGFTDYILGLSLHTGGCPTEGVTMKFKDVAPNPGVVRLSQFLPRRSLYVMTGLAKSTYTHGIDTSPHDLVDGQLRLRQGTRMSFTFRSFANVPADMKDFVGKPIPPAIQLEVRAPRSPSSRAERHSAGSFQLDDDLAAAIAASLSGAGVVDEGAAPSMHNAAGRRPSRRADKSSAAVHHGPVVVLESSDEDAAGPPRSSAMVGRAAAAVVDLSAEPDTTSFSGSGKRRREQGGGLGAARVVVVIE